MESTVVAQSREQTSPFTYPKQVYLILANEVCERFSYYGIHTILLIYLASMHMLRKEVSIAIYHGFNMLCYMSPLLGAILSDSFLGRYKTILYISVVYCIGSLVLTVTSVPAAIRVVGISGPLVGLFLIAIGTGGIKPCVSTFGADQFGAHNEKLLQSYFSVFYFSINLGSLVSMIVTPMLRSDVNCFNEDCYFAAFGLPSILMLLSLVLFLIGRKMYVRIDPEKNIIYIVVKVSVKAVCARFKGMIHQSNRREQHWIDWAKEDADAQLLEDIKAFYRVMVLFIPIPVFWTLFDQQGSRWTIQAMELSGNLGMIGVIKPDQIQALNPILVLVLIPVFEAFIYPAFRRINVLVKPLTRMSVGMVMVVISFLVAGALQMRMQKLSSFANLPSAGCSHMRIVNALPDTSISVNSSHSSFPNVTEILSYNTSEYRSLKLNSNDNIIISLLMDDGYLRVKEYPKNITIRPDEYDIVEGQSYTIIVGLGLNISNSTNSSYVITKLMRDDYLPEYEVAKVRLVAVNNVNGRHNEATVDISERNVRLVSMEPSVYHRIPYGSHVVLIDGVSAGVISFRSGFIYTVLIAFDNENDKPEIFVLGDVEPRPLSILWQIPQYVLITSGEVLFSVTGLDFAYASSPKSMKSLMTASWLLTVSTGNFIVVLFEGMKFTDDMAYELFIFAALLFVTTVVFSIMSHYFVPYDPSVGLNTDQLSSDDALLADHKASDDQTTKQL